MSTAALKAPEYAFSYVGAPATDAAKLKSLKLAGPLLLAKQHKVIELLPDAFDDTSYAPNFQATQTDMHEMLFAGSLLDADMVKDGVHFALSKGRMAKFIFDLDHGGMDWTPIKGEGYVAFPKATARVTACLTKLPDDQRIIKKADLWYDGATDNAGTGSCQVGGGALGRSQRSC